MSYVHNDPTHSFLKVVRPVDRPIESPFGLLPAMYDLVFSLIGVSNIICSYKTPVGLNPDGNQDLDNPTGSYLLTSLTTHVLNRTQTT